MWASHDMDQGTEWTNNSLLALPLPHWSKGLAKIRVFFRDFKATAQMSAETRKRLRQGEGVRGKGDTVHPWRPLFTLKLVTDRDLDHDMMFGCWREINRLFGCRRLQSITMLCTTDCGVDFNG